MNTQAAVQEEFDQNAKIAKQGLSIVLENIESRRYDLASAPPCEGEYGMNFDSFEDVDMLDEEDFGTDLINSGMRYSQSCPEIERQKYQIFEQPILKKTQKYYPWM